MRSVVNENDWDDRSDEQVGSSWSKRRIGIVACGAALAVLALAYLVVYAIRYHPKPSDLAVPSVLFIGLGTLAVLVIPWKELGFMPTEMFGLKFEQIANTQKQEQIAAIVPIQEELKKLKENYDSMLKALEISNPGFIEQHKLLIQEAESRLSPAPAATAATAAPLDPTEKLRALLIRFFRKYRGSFFNPARIQGWGSSRAGFNAFNEFSVDEIEQELFKGVADNSIDTMVSGSGTTLYGLSRGSRRG